MRLTRISRGSHPYFSEDDMEAMNRLMGQLSSVPKTLTKQELHRAVMRGWLFLIRDEDERICGMSTLQIVESLTGRKGLVEDVVVDERHRGKGLGRFLMSGMISYAKERGIPKIDLTSAPSRAAANALYVALGFERRQTNVYRLTL